MAAKGNVMKAWKIAIALLVAVMLTFLGFIYYQRSKLKKFTAIPDRITKFDTTGNKITIDLNIAFYNPTDIDIVVNSAYLDFWIGNTRIGSTYINSPQTIAANTNNIIATQTVAVVSGIAEAVILQAALTKLVQGSVALHTVGTASVTGYGITISQVPLDSTKTFTL